MEMQFKNEIKKLADIVVWADNWITNLKDGLTEEEIAEDEAVKEFETVKKVVLESMERHTVYTNALNKDLADKAAKINLLEKEIEGRKEGYVALKELMDTKYISIDEHNNICEDFKKKIAELEEKVKHQRENLDGINKTLEIRTKEKESLVKVRNNLNKEIEAHESENARLTERIIGLKEEVKKRDKCIMEKNESINTGNEAIVNLRKQIGEHEEENKRLSDKIMKLHGTITELSHDIDNYKSWNASLHKDIKELKKERDKHIIDRNATIMQLEKQVKYLEKELNETCTCKELDLKGHNRREMALVNELADKNDEIKKLNESIEEWKNQERIRTDQLRATERKVEELWKEIERLRDLGEHWKRSYFNIRYSLNKLKDESKEDDHGRKGFKEYIEWLVKEEERAVPERFKERLNEEITAIFTKEEEPVKYRPSEIDRFTYFLKEEVDKKRIVDIRYGVEDDLHVTRDLLVAAVKLIVAKGYHEYDGVTTGYGRFHVLTAPDVEFKDLYDTWKIKSIGPDIPCGEDAIE